MIKFEYITKIDALKNACKKIKENKIVGIDIESENNLHHYGNYTSLFQLSSGDDNWIVDAIELKDLTPLLDVLKDETIQKIFHDVSFDLRIIFDQYKTHVKNIFDTQLASLLLGKTALGLCDLLLEFFTVEKKCEFQTADWSKRPLSEEMLKYAVKDSRYLIPLTKILNQKLKSKGRIEWAKQEFKHLEEMDWSLKHQAYNDVKGWTLMTDSQRGVFKEYYLIRESLAKQSDKPAHFIISTRRLIEIASNPPNENYWRAIRGVHPIVKRNAHLFAKASKAPPIAHLRPRLKRYTMKQRSVAELLNLKLAELAEKNKIPKHLIANKDQILDIVLNGSTESLRPWQEKLLLE